MGALAAWSNVEVLNVGVKAGVVKGASLDGSGEDQTDNRCKY